jgi:hypothetical protein
MALGASLTCALSISYHPAAVSFSGLTALFHHIGHFKDLRMPPLPSCCRLAQPRIVLLDSADELQPFGNCPSMCSGRSLQIRTLQPALGPQFEEL